MKSLWLKSATAAAALAVCAYSGAASADTSTTTASPALSGSSTAEATVAKKPAAPLPIGISDYSMIVGPALKDPMSGKAADDAIDALQPMSSRQFFSVVYKFNPNLTLGPTLDFIYNFNDVPGAYERGITWNDSFLSLKAKEILKTKLSNYDISGDVWVNAYAPMSHGSRLNNQMGQLSLWFNPTIQPHGSRWSLSAYNFAKFYGQTRANDVNSGSALRRWTYYAGPQVNYEFSDKVTAFVLYEANLRLYTDGLTDADKNGARSLTDLEPGVAVGVTKEIMLFPYLNWYLNQSIDTTSIGLNASFKLL